ncbi:myelin expression factor 2-like [Tubulanus polymorphus]|uniref:myelin expression factor 2-like n=1 Tax=Tubulanus polymorphus TaxID=672921 RepID=UPI003DA2413E
MATGTNNGAGMANYDYNNGADGGWNEPGVGRTERSRSPKRSRSRSPNDRRDRRRGGGRSRDRDRDRGTDSGGEAKEVRTRRAFICNLPYDVSWQDLKDLCKQEVGDAYVEVYDEKGKSTGCAAAEFRDVETCKKAIENLHRKELKGRLIVVREETPADRRRFDRSEKGRRGDDRSSRSSRMERRPLMDTDSTQPLNTHGINPQILKQLNIEGPLVNTVFVANLDYKVDDKKLEEIFKMAGKTVKAEIKKDKDGNSRGFGSVEFDHPVQAVQAISMFNGQTLFDRAMAVKMDKEARPKKQELPSGLQGVGKGLGIGGAPINDPNDISSSLNTMSNSMNMNMDNIGMGMGMGTGGNMGLGAMNMGMPGMGMNNLPMNSSSLGGMGSNSMLGMPSISDMGMNPSLLNMNNMSSGLSLGSSLGAGSGMGSGMGSLGSGMGSGLGGSMGSGYGSGGMGNMDGLLGSGAAMNSMNMGLSGGMGNMRGNLGGGGGLNRENTTIIVRDLPYTYTWQNLRERFCDCGEVKYAEIKTENGKSRGIGIIRFATSKEAIRAVNLMDGSRIEGRAIKVRLDE